MTPLREQFADDEETLLTVSKIVIGIIYALCFILLLAAIYR